MSVFSFLLICYFGGLEAQLNWISLEIGIEAKWTRLVFN